MPANVQPAEQAGHKSSCPTPLLDTIHSPADLRALPADRLGQLCAELRADLVDAVSQCGGHFASSLGTVELSVALHRVFETPEDRIVFDTGHQGYIHKILTGRREQLRKVRQKGGISGFLRRDESEYDCFGAGHAGTSISAAAGMAEAAFHEFPGSHEHCTVAVIGDAAIATGMAFEALNHSGTLSRPLIVVLNDNEMSIAPSVGALSSALSKTVAGPLSTRARKYFRYLVDRGFVPEVVYKVIDRAEEAAQGFLSSPAMLLSFFGYRYIGPIDGHDVHAVIDALQRARAQAGPVLVHAITRKGKGYEPAELDPIKYHGVTPFNIASGSFRKSDRSSPKSYTAVFGECLVDIAKQDPRVAGITAGMPDGTGLKLLQKEMPDRYFDVGIAEEHAVTFAAGLACEGMRPVVSIYSTFLQRGFDQILHDVCIQNLPVIFAMDRGGLVGADGATHHGVFDMAYLRMLPNMTIMAPRDAGELRDMLLTAVEHTGGPIAIRYPRAEALGADVLPPPKKLPLGKAEILRQAAAFDVALIGIGHTVPSCLTAAATLAEDFGIDATVINARFVKPLDAELFSSLAGEYKLLVTVEDHVLAGGFGSALLEFFNERGLKVNLTRLGIGDVFIEHGTQPELYELCGIDVPAIVRRVRKALGLRVTKKAANA